MKRAFLVLLAALLTVPLPAESRYSVFKAKGTVMVCPKADKIWTDATQNRELQLNDRLLLGKSSSVRILDSTNNLIYTYEKEGECTVMEALRIAKDNAGALTKAVNAEMRRDIRSKDNEQSYNVLGVSFRGQKAVSYTDSLAALLCLLPQKEEDGSRLSLTVEQTEDASVFVLRNSSDYPLYVNVLRVNGDDLTICLEFDGKEGSEGVLVNAGSEIVLDQYPFVVQEGAAYLAFGTFRCYDTRSLQRALLRGGGKDTLTTGFVY